MLEPPRSFSWPALSPANKPAGKTLASQIANAVSVRTGISPLYGAEVFWCNYLVYCATCRRQERITSPGSRWLDSPAWFFFAADTPGGCCFAWRYADKSVAALRAHRGRHPTNASPRIIGRRWSSFGSLCPLLALSRRGAFASHMPAFEGIADIDLIPITDFIGCRELSEDASVS